MRFAIVKNGIVTNVVVADAPLESNWIQTDTAGPNWLYDGSTFTPPPVVLPSKDVQQAARAEAYRTEADPVFFQYQRGEATEQDWLDKIEEIRARYPYPEAN